MATSVIVYRVQHKEAGSGPFMGPGSAEIYGSHSWHFNMMPAAFGDIPEFSSSHVCAFPSLDMLRRWMKYENVPQVLAHHGYMVLAVQLPAYAVNNGFSGCQVGYNPADGEVVNTLTIEEALS